MAKWTVKQASKVTWFYLCTPRVPGGVMRIMVTDDYGHLVPISIESASISLS